MTIDYVLFDPGNVTPRGAVEDKCHYSNWTSCSYFCGDKKEEFSYRALLDDTPKARAECPIPKKPCDESVVCTGDIYKPEQSDSQEHRGHQSSGARAPELCCPHIFFRVFLMVYSHLYWQCSDKTRKCPEHINTLRKKEKLIFLKPILEIKTKNLFST